MGYSGPSPPMQPEEYNCALNVALHTSDGRGWRSLLPLMNARKVGYPGSSGAAVTARVSWRWPSAGQAPEPVTYPDLTLPLEPPPRVDSRV